MFDIFPCWVGEDHIQEFLSEGFKGQPRLDLISMIMAARVQKFGLGLRGVRAGVPAKPQRLFLHVRTLGLGPSIEGCRC